MTYPNKRVVVNRRDCNWFKMRGGLICFLCAPVCSSSALAETFPLAICNVMLAKLTIAAGIVAACLPLVGGELAVAVTAPKRAIYVGDGSHFPVTITNRGPNPVTLVQPGDGSEVGWRTPKVGWSILPVAATGRKHPVTPPSVKEPRCGNINSIGNSEVFSLKPGEGRRLDSWIGHPRFEGPGKFRVVFYYQNIPDLKITGLPLGPHEDGVLERIRQSTACRIESEEIVVEVLQARPKRLDEEGVYSVVKGDTLTKFARRFQISVNELLALNPDAEPVRLRVGQVLTVKRVEE